MGYQRKTRDVWYLLVDYGQGFEHETTEPTYADARAQLRCYRVNCPQYPARLKRARERIAS